MKRKLIIMGTIIASLSLTGCNTNDTEPETGTPNETEENIKDDIEETGEDIKDTTEDAGEEIKEGAENIGDKIDEVLMTDEQMIEESDYITKVKMIEKEKNEFELKVLENVQGELSKEDIPNADTLQKNREYLVFSKIVKGSVEPTNGEKSYILLEGDNQEIFEKINKHKNR